MKISDSNVQEVAFQALDSFRIEIPSWGFANTGTRFGKFVQAAAASTIEEKFADAAEVNRLTGVTPWRSMCFGICPTGSRMCQR
jgi:L-rhamnose isomerase/sugar isomerase